MRKPRSGFTHIELLVGIALISIVAALTFSALTRAKTMQNQSDSAARLRQWGYALTAYLGEHDGDLPRRGQGVQKVTVLDRPEDWFNALPPYVGVPPYSELVESGKRPNEKDRTIFVRPGAKDPGGIAFLSYGMNMNLSPWNLPSPTRYALIERPVVTVFLAESPGEYASTYPSTKPFSCIAPHDGKGNVLFLDGHVTAYTDNELGVGRGDPGREDVRWLTGTVSDSQAPNFR